jgi:hypothetical protein
VVSKGILGPADASGAGGIAFTVPARPVGRSRTVATSTSAKRAAAGSGFVLSVCRRPVPDDPRQLGDERLDPPGSGRHRDHGQRHLDGHYPVHAGDGVAHDHRRQDRGHRRTTPGLRRRARRLRRRVPHHRAVPEPGCAAGGLVGARGHRRRADHARHRGACGGQLPGRTPDDGLRDDRRRGRDRGGRGPAHRRGGDHLRVVAVGLRGRSRDRGRRAALRKVDDAPPAAAYGSTCPAPCCRSPGCRCWCSAS